MRRSPSLLASVPRRDAQGDRAALHLDDVRHKHLTFHDLRATGITWMAVRGDDPLKIKQRAGHTTFSTTEGYIREAEDLRESFGEPADVPLWLYDPMVCRNSSVPARAPSRLVPPSANYSPEISASGTSGRFTANAVASVNGLHFRSGEAHLRIAEKDKLPLTAQGIELGTVWGQVDTKAALAGDGKAVNIDVNVPRLHVALPDSLGHGVQSTDPDRSIKVGTIQKDGIVAILPVDGASPPPKPPEPKTAATIEQPLKLHVVTHLGPDLEIRRGTMLKAYVTDGPTIDIGKEAKVSGKLTVPRGYIELQGKRFQIEKATVNFTGQPTDDPVVVATAAYDSPDGTKVLADFVGPVKTGKLTLRSEPALSQNEILALLLFGSADGTFGQAAPPGQQGNDTTQAASLAGGVVTEGLNKAISGVSGVDVQTKVDTQESGDPRPEVEVALSRAISATIIYNLGVPPPGQNPDDTLLVVDWRFHKNYSTEATLGDKGTSILDLTWKYRY
jgi:translocation and assembly module TamB